MAIAYQCFEDFLLEGGGGGSRKNDHEFPFLNNIELYKRSLTRVGVEMCHFSSAVILTD